MNCLSPNAHQKNNNLIPASAKRVYQVTSSDLPLCCPMPDMRLWDAHPRVYLPIEQLGKMECPYCSAEYILTDAP